MQYCKLQFFAVDISFAHSVMICTLPCNVAPGVTGLRVGNSGRSVDGARNCGLAVNWDRIFPS